MSCMYCFQAGRYLVSRWENTRKARAGRASPVLSDEYLAQFKVNIDNVVFKYRMRTLISIPAEAIYAERHTRSGYHCRKRLQGIFGRVRYEQNFGQFKERAGHPKPIFRLALGMCPTLAITTSVMNGLGMGLPQPSCWCFPTAHFSYEKVIPDKIRIPAFIVVIATFVTIVEMVMNKFMFDLYEQLGVFIALITVNCIVFARAESYASATCSTSAVDGFAVGLGFTVALCLMGLVASCSPSERLLALRSWATGSPG